ncbi:MAG: hypothetical protein AAGF87_14955 [Bacteroidota bacterium]
MGVAQIAIFRLADCCARIQEDMSGYYNTAAIEKVPQIEFIFRWLRRRNISICLISDFNRADTEQILSRLGWQPDQDQSLIDAIIIKSKRTAGEILTEVCNLFGLADCQKVISLFDKVELLKAAWQHNCLLSIGLNYGSTTPRELSRVEQHILLDSIIELPNYLTRILTLSDMPQNKPLRVRQSL